MGPSVALVILATVVSVTQAQLPRRIQIPGAVAVAPITEARPLPYRRVLPAPPQQQYAPAPKLRRPPPNSAPIHPRPVVEESEDDEGPLSRDEVAKLHNIPLAGPPPQQVRLPPPQQVRLPPPQPQRALIEDDDEEDVPVRQYAQPAPIQFRPAPQVRLQPQQVPVRQAQQVQRSQAPARPRQPAQNYAHDEEGRPGRTRKPPIKILRKYREDNPDGSITWGYENDDGTFKEETIGIDCVTRGKYGYIDPDGNRREYSYETGLRCDIPQEDDEELPEEAIPFRPKNNQPLKRPGQAVPVRLQ